MTTTPRVTIGLPVYNSEQLIKRAVDSVLSQTLGDFELLISDNGSKDATEDICRSYARVDSRVVFSKTERNLGAAGNHVRLVGLARTEFFKWIAHDDWIAPDFLEKCVAAAEQDPEIITVAPVVSVVDEHGTQTQTLDSHIGQGQWSADRLDQYRQMMDELAYCETHDDGLLFIAYLYGLHRLSLLRKTRLLMPFICSDYVLAAELALSGRLFKLDETLSFYMVSTSATGNSSNFASWNPAAIQRMLAPDHVGRLNVLLSVRQRHLEHVRAVLRSPLSGAEKALAVEAATRPMLARFGARVDKAVRGASSGSG